MPVKSKASRSGRPLKPDSGNPALEKRRARVRRAQEAFRRRKDERIQSLESQLSFFRKTIDEMSLNLEIFADFALNSDLVSQHATSGKQLQQLIQTFMRLVERATRNFENGGTPDADVPTATSNQTSNLSLAPSEIELSSTGCTIDPLLEEPMPIAISRDLSNVLDEETRYAIDFDSLDLDFLEGYAADLSKTSSDLLPRISTTPSPLDHQLPEGLVSARPLGSSLIQSTLHLALSSIRNSNICTQSHQLASSMFRYATKINTVDHIEARIRWHLSMGPASMIRLGYAGFPQDTDEEYINAFHVEDYLRAYNATQVDGNFLMLQNFAQGEVGDPTDSGKSQRIFNMTTDRYLESKSSSNGSTPGVHIVGQRNVLHPGPKGVGPVTVDLNTLYRNLAIISVCLEYGPGFKRGLLNQAITAAIVA